MLVLWPACQDMAVRFSSVNIKQACEEAESFNSGTSRAEKTSLVEFLLSRSSQQPALIGRAVSHAALVWKDSSLWTRAVIAAGQHSGCSVFTSYEPLWSAILAFGFKNICSGYVLSNLYKDESVLIHFAAWMLCLTMKNATPPDLHVSML